MKYIPIHGWASNQEDPQHSPTCEVHEADDHPVKTGILDSMGTPIYRVSEKAPLGFCR